MYGFGLTKRMKIFLLIHTLRRVISDKNDAAIMNQSRHKTKAEANLAQKR